MEYRMSSLNNLCHNRHVIIVEPLHHANMTTIYLPLTSIILSTTQLHAISGAHERENVQWHSHGSDMYVLIENRPEMDFRMDREVIEFKV